jgi:hypothetical protein
MMLFRSGQTSQSVPALRIDFVFGKGRVGVIFSEFIGLGRGFSRQEHMKSDVISDTSAIRLLRAPRTIAVACEYIYSLAVGVIAHTNDVMKCRQPQRIANAGKHATYRWDTGI